MKLIINRQLAWELADQLAQHLSDKERMAVFVDLGSGEDAAAIHRLIQIAAKHKHPLPSRTSMQLYAWANHHHVQEHYAPALARIESVSVTEVGIAALHARLPAVKDTAIQPVMPANANAHEAPRDSVVGC